MKNKVLEQKSQDYWCDYNATNITPPILWRRMNNGGHRFYYAEDNDEIIIGAGITTVIAKAFPESIFLRDWKDRTPNHKELLNTMANYGTLCHIGFQSLLTDKKLDSSLIEIADEVFGMREKFKRDMVSLAFFIEKHNVKPLFIEGILAKKVINKNGYVDYICTAIDLFCEMDIEEKNEVQDGYYKSGERKGEPKFVKEVTTKRVFAILDLKSNYDDKEEKSFFDSHFMQLLHGASCIEEQFGIKPLMFNLSTKKWTKEPAYFSLVRVPPHVAMR